MATPARNSGIGKNTTEAAAGNGQTAPVSTKGGSTGANKPAPAKDPKSVTPHETASADVDDEKGGGGDDESKGDAKPSSPVEKADESKTDAKAPLTAEKTDESKTDVKTPAAAEKTDGTGSVAAKEAVSASSILGARPFVLKTSLLTAATTADTPNSVEVTGSILSQTLDDPRLGVLTKREAAAGTPTAVGTVANAGTLTLATIRTLIPSMSRFSSIHKFCTKSGTLIDDERIDLITYFAMEPQEQPTAPATGTRGSASLDVFYRAPAADYLKPPATLPTAPTISTTLTDNSAGAQKATGLADLKSLDLTSKNPYAAGNNSTSPATNAGQLTETQWHTVLRNCAVFYGWILDPQTNAVRRAPQAAFQLRSPKIESSADVQGQTGTALSGQLGSGQSSNASSARVAQPGSDTTAAAGSTPTDPAVDASQSGRPTAGINDGGSSETATNAVSATSEAPADSSAVAKPEVANAENGTANGISVAEAKANRDQQSPPNQGRNDQSNESASLPPGPGIPKKNVLAIPNYRVNDDSKIDIIVCSHSMETSMAKNDFSSQSTSASVSGGAMGITVGVSAGYASSNSQSNKQEEKEATKTMVARYMYPRCDLFLTSTDLEPTPEFATLLEVIRTTKSIRALRRLQKEYGQLFCQEVTLGARLLTTQTMSSKYTGTEEQQKEQYKVSVGLSVSTPYGGASVNHEQEKGHEESKTQSETTSNESNAFEASGGDTILANNPPAWCATVSSPETWRVINRNGRTPVVQMLSEMPGYAAVQSWFVQAVPALSKYLTLDDSHVVTGRFKVMHPPNSLHVRNTDGKARHYLGFHDDISSPSLLTTDTTIVDGQCKNFWMRIDSTVEKRLFEPNSYRAPVIQGFNDFDVQGTKFGASYNDQFAAVNWDIIAPFSDVLAHGTRVILRTKPRGENTVPTHMVVFRNEQGEFLPGISDRDEYQYWRLLLTSPDARPGMPIKVSDEVRLAWSFKDQTTGYRDYSDDTFGRRQTLAPTGTPDVLYLKVPWPRFENEGRPTNMILSSRASRDDALCDVCTVHGTWKYLLQDVRFRLDTVENNGAGDADDYLLKGVAQQGDNLVNTSIQIRLPGASFQINSNILGFGIWC